MRSVIILAAAGAASLMSSVAFAADIPVAPPPQYYAPPPVEDFGGWYLRGDIGMTNTRGKLFAPAYNDASTVSVNQIGHEFTGGMTYGLGVGYQFNNWFRMDVTGEYRSRVQFSGTDYANINFGGGLGVLPIGDTYRGGYSSWVGMINAYADLGTWWCITPFVGVGVGGAYNTFSGFSDVTTVNLGGGTTSGLYQAQTASKLDLAWALHAGLAYRVNQNMTVELAYRYLNLGTGVTGSGSSFDGTVTNGRPFQFHDLTSHDIKLGVRWTCCDVAPPPPPPLITKG
ncbi:MAG: porin family protein [Rhizobiales bacterium]|nr:porin family protein [Hyphomicrobiales bacterium]